MGLQFRKGWLVSRAWGRCIAQRPMRSKSLHKAASRQVGCRENTLFFQSMPPMPLYSTHLIRLAPAYDQT